MDKVRKPNISVCYTPSSEPYSIYTYFVVFARQLVLVEFKPFTRICNTNFSFLPGIASLASSNSEFNVIQCSYDKNHRIPIVTQTSHVSPNRKDGRQADTYCCLTLHELCGMGFSLYAGYTVDQEITLSYRTKSLSP
jgi:hypothetical protein